jgi:hypothetical protein
MERQFQQRMLDEFKQVRVKGDTLIVGTLDAKRPPAS